MSCCGPASSPAGFDLSPKALRLYAEHGLLVPARLDERTGYRYYAVDQVERGHLIAVLRRAGMPLGRIGEVLDLDGPALAVAVGRWWRGVEQDVSVRRELIRYLDRYLTGRQELMYDVQLRDTPELKMLTAERRVNVDGLDEFIDTATAAITRQLDASGIVDRAALRVIYHGMVTRGQ